MLAPVLAALWLVAPTASDARVPDVPQQPEPAPDTPPADKPSPEKPADRPAGSFFGGDVTAPATAPATTSSVPPPAAVEGPAKAPPV